MRKKGLDPPGLCDVCHDFVPVLIAKWKSGSDCGLDFPAAPPPGRVIFTSQFFAVMFSYQPKLKQNKPHILVYLDCQY